MASKKQRNHYDLKENENYCRAKTFQRDRLEKGEKQILAEPQNYFPFKADNYIPKRADLSLQISNVKSTSFMISTKGQAILVTQKQCQVI